MYVGIDGSFGSNGFGVQSIVGVWGGAGGGFGPWYGFCGTRDVRGAAVLRLGCAGALEAGSRRGADGEASGAEDSGAAVRDGTAGAGDASAEGGDGTGDGVAGTSAVVPAAGVAGPGRSAAGAPPPAAPEQPPTSRPPATRTETAPVTLPLEPTPATHRSARSSGQRGRA